MSRVKTFDATGVAPNGVFFAGDANAIQDHYADLSNFAQTVDLATLRVGDTSLQIVKYGAGEFRMTGALRADGILRGLSGVAPGIYTTTQRDAIVAGQRPQGMMIFNSTTFQIEVNKGTDAVPTWEAVGFSALPVGAILPWTGSEGVVPAGFGLADGSTLVRLSFPALDALYNSQGYPFGAGNGTTTFNKPDLRGRSLLGRDNMGGTAANRVPGVNAVGAVGGTYQETLDISKIPAHSHTGATGSTTPTASSANAGAHGHTINDPGHLHAIPNWATNTSQGTNNGYAAGAFFVGSIITQGAASGLTTSQTTGISINGVADHSHAITVNAHTHTITAEGGGNPHNNMHPYLAINWIVKLL